MKTKTKNDKLIKAKKFSVDIYFSKTGMGRQIQCSDKTGLNTNEICAAIAILDCIKLDLLNDFNNLSNDK